MNGRGIVAAAVLALAVLAGCVANGAPRDTGAASAHQSPTPSPQPTTPSPEASCACSHGPTPPAGAISREAARAAAMRAVSGGATTGFADVSPDPFGSGRQVWIVRVQGRLALPSCTASEPPTTPASSSAGPCLDGDGGVDVVLDIMTGELLGWTR